MTTLLRVALMATFFAPPCIAQTGTVTFYTPGNSLRSEAASLLPQSQQPFTGWLFDGWQQLAHLRAGRFMTFHLKTGVHSFTVPWRSNRPGKDHLVLNVVTGGQYCVRLYAKMTNLELLPVTRLDSQIEEVPCQQAQRETTRMKPLEIKRVAPSVLVEFDAAAAFPSEGQSEQ